MIRAYERFPVEGPVSLRIPDCLLNICNDSNLDNVSFGGFAMNSRQKIDVDVIIDFKLKSPLIDEPLAGKGKVRYTREDIVFENSYKIGVEFIAVNKELLQHLITKLQNAAAEDIKFRQRYKKVEFRDIPL